MENNYEIVPIFPIPLLKTILPKNLSTIVPWLDSQPLEKKYNTKIAENYGVRSQNTYILDNDECKELKDTILRYALILGQTLGFECTQYKITQSWISLKYPNQSHTRHTHSNSLLSGVFYYGSSYEAPQSQLLIYNENNINSGAISAAINPNIPPNPFNTEVIPFSPSPGELILFPSTLPHAVPKNISNKVRKSLAFNIVPIEGFGDEEGLNRLKFN